MNSQIAAKRLSFPVAIEPIPYVAHILETNLAELVGLFGEPSPLNDPPDHLNIKRWAFEYSCGLQLVYQLDVTAQMTFVTADLPEVAHVARHLPFPTARIKLISDADLQTQMAVETRNCPEKEIGWNARHIAQVWRQGDDGNKFSIGTPTSERDAKCRVAELESHGHKQLYWYTITT